VIQGIAATDDTGKKRLCIALFIPVLVNSFTEFGIFGETNYGIMFYLFIVFMVVLKPSHENVRITSTHANSAGSLFRSTASA
jgi:hypothetical protein